MLVYKVDSLKKFEERADWEREVRSKDNVENDVPCEDLFDCDLLSTYNVGLRRAKVQGAMEEKGSYTEEQLQTGWETHQALYHEQQRLRESDAAAEQVAIVISQLPNLKSFALSNCGNLTNDKSLHVTRPPGSLMTSIGGVGHGQPGGVHQLIYAFRALHKAGTALKSLYFGSVDWRVFDASDSDFKSMKCVVSNLNDFIANIDTNQGWHGSTSIDDYDFFGEYGLPEPELEKCSTLLRHGRMLELLGSIPNLRTLGLIFHQSLDRKKIDLKVLVGDLHWPFLNMVDLHHIGSTEKDLLGFLRRHAATLRGVNICNYRLTSGNWASVFRGIRTSLKLMDFWPIGLFLNDNEEDDNRQILHMRFPHNPPGRIPIGNHIKHYVVGGGDDTPIDLSKYPSGWTAQSAHLEWELEAYQYIYLFCLQQVHGMHGGWLTHIRG
ncbi:MAG: hypothetical protein Q9169_003519 [Polycauliona sp. 2 TL-2023]